MGFPLNTKILTINGWKDIQDIEIGEKLISTNGEESILLEKEHIQESLIFIEISNGTIINCSKNQLLPVNVQGGFSYWNKELQKKCKNTKGFRLFSADKIFNYVNNNKTDIYIKDSPPVFFPKKEIPVDPYILGLLLGDGSFRLGRPQLTSMDNEIKESFINFAINNNYKYRVREGKSKASEIFLYKSSCLGLIEILKEYNLWNKLSKDKHIPEIYKNSDINDRISILQGLMDTDGHISNNKDRSFELSTVSKQLALDIQYIMESLGGRANITERPSIYTSNGQRIVLDHPNYRLHLNFRGNDDVLNISPFKLTRKRERYFSKNTIKRDFVKIRNASQGNLLEECINIITTNSYFIDHFIGVEIEQEIR